MQYAMTAFLLGIVFGCDGIEDPAAARPMSVSSSVERITLLNMTLFFGNWKVPEVIFSYTQRARHSIRSE